VRKVAQRGQGDKNKLYHVNEKIILFCHQCHAYNWQWHDLLTAPLKPRPYGALEIWLLLSFTLHESVKYFTKYGAKVYGAFLDASKAFDKVLHNGLFKSYWINMYLCLLCCYWKTGTVVCAAQSIKWNNAIGECFQTLCGVRQGGILSPYLFTLYVDDLIKKLRSSGYGLHIRSLFVGCILYADDIVLVSPSCFGLQKLHNICEQFASNWDIKFNPDKSQFGHVWW